MAKENKSRYAILGMLSIHSGSGYGLKRMMERSTSNFWSESYGQIYPILKQLMEEGLATSQTEKQEGKPERYVYTITEKGRTELQRWLTQPIEEVHERNELLLKLFFGPNSTLADNIEHILSFQTLQQQILKHFEDIEEQLKHNNIEEERIQIKYSLITLSYGKHRCRAYLDWCEETLAILRAIP